MTSQGFAKRAARITNHLMQSAPVDTFAPVSDVVPETYNDVEPEDMARILSVLEKMGYAEIQADANGVKSIRITEAGASLRGVSLGGE